MTLPLPLADGESGAWLFDCDGTLVDSMPLHLDAWRAALEQHGFPGASFTHAMHHAFAGMPGPAIVRKLNAQFGCDLPPEQVEKDKLEWYLAHHDLIQPIGPVVDFAKSQAGVRPMAVASGSDRAVVLAALDGIGITDLFQTIITPVDVARGKPAPDMYLLAADRLGVKPAACVVFEDGLLGIQAAQAAGMSWVYLPENGSPSCGGPADSPVL